MDECLRLRTTPISLLWRRQFPSVAQEFQKTPPKLQASIADVIRRASTYYFEHTQLVKLSIPSHTTSCKTTPLSSKIPRKQQSIYQIMAPNPLQPETILQAMADALPNHKPGDTTSDLSSSYEALALFVHACMVSLGFRLIGFNEDKLIGMCLPPSGAVTTSLRIHLPD